MSLSIDDVQRIAKLARIRVNEAEAAGYQAQLNGIFGLIEAMQAVDTAGVEPMSHAQDLSQRLRADAVTEPDRRQAFQAVAPQTENGLYLVPKVIE
jgi:aspartyl-tRNA(Asn)/glutamyl-tRNA(Gln) amidotransferase subunit C